MNKETWKANNDRVAWVQRHLEELREIEGLDDPPERYSELEDWLESHKGAVTQKLDEDDNDE